MKKTLKFIYTFVMSFIVLGTVNALEVNFEYGKEFPELREIYEFIKSKEDNLMISYSYDYGTLFEIFDKDLEYVDDFDYDKMCSLYLPSVELDGRTYYVTAERYYSSEKDARGTTIYEYEIMFLDKNCNVKYSDVIEVDDSFYFNYFNETENEFVFIDENFYNFITYDKETEELSYYEYDELNDDELKLFLGDYYYAAIKLEKIRNVGYFEVRNEDGYSLLMYETYKYNEDTDEDVYTEHFMVINLNDGSVSQEKTFVWDRDLFFDFENGYVYILEDNVVEDNDPACLLHDEETEVETPDYCYSQLKLSVFDVNMELVLEKKLQVLESEYYDFWYYGRDVSSFVVSGDEMYIATDSYEPKDYLPDYEHELVGDNPIVVKYSIVYNILSTNDGNGNVEITKNAKAGDKVTYKVTPNEGFEIDSIIVTDSKGNVVEVADNTFVMPYGDVNIDVKFKKIVSNPNTISISVGVVLVIVLLGAFVTYINDKKLRWLR